MQGQWGIVRGELGRQFEPFALGWLREHGQRVFDHVHQAEIHRFELQLAGFDFGEIQNVVNDPQQMAARCLHCFRPDPLLRPQLAVHQQLVHAQHAVHRGADFMAHGRQEFALGLACGFCGFFGLLQLGRALLHLLFEVVAVQLQADVALMDLLQHAVEAIRQRVEFSDVAGVCAHAVAVIARHALHQRVQPRQGLQNRVIEAAQQQAAGGQRQRSGSQCGQDLPGGLAVQASQSHGEGQVAGGLRLGQHRLA